MQGDNGPKIFAYKTPPAAELPAKQLVIHPGSPEEQRFIFYDRIEIGRYKQNQQDLPSFLYVQDSTLSSRHCIVTQAPDGRCFIRDVSRNGTRLAGRRLIPNLEVEFELGQIISVGNRNEFQLRGQPREAASSTAMPYEPGTLLVTDTHKVTVLVGDIRDYTVLVQRVDPESLQSSVRRVFRELEAAVVRYAGTVKEFRGDAIFAFWEEGASDNAAVAACHAALALNELACRLAADRAIWALANHPLRMEWALATGLVTIGNFGGERPTGLSVIGEPVVRAFRLEKFADERTGPIIICAATRERSAEAFAFRDLGERQAKGFAKPDKVFALLGKK
jgi:class 3 adenylate cyclase